MKASGEKGTVAVVGSGISGISTAWLLHRSGFKVTLLEKDSTVGGHTLTDDSAGVPVDLGFQVFNYTNYPNMVGFLDALGVESEPSDMSFALSVDGGGLEWASFGLDTIFSQRKNILSPSFWRMILDVLRFNNKAPEVLNKNKTEFRGMSLGSYLKRGRYSSIFTSKYLLPMCAAIWSVPTKTVLDFPVQMMVQFWVNHHLLSLIERPLWRVVKDRSRSYLTAVLKELPDVRTNAEVVSIKRSPSSHRVKVCTKNGAEEKFDHVVLACHSDQALNILGEQATPLERSVLSGIPYSVNDVFLHTDESLMPQRKHCWASWNCIEDRAMPAPGSAPLGETERAVCVTYWLNHLQNLPESAPTLLCTLNPLHPPDPTKVLRKLVLAHPVFGASAEESQRRLPEIQGKAGVWFAGAWAGYGFHEDGINAGIAVAKGLGATIPWVPRATSPNLGIMPRFYLALFTKFANLAINKGNFLLRLPDGSEQRLGGPTEPGTVSPVLRVMDMKSIERIVKTADIGLGEAYMLGEVECSDLLAMMNLMAKNVQGQNEHLGKMGVFNFVGSCFAYIAHRLNSNTIEGSRRNISAHYDAGNDMYKLFLDDTMMYSSAVHTAQEKKAILGGQETHVELKAAQHRKLDLIIKQAGITSEHHVLEIGCGWGGFAIRAAKTTGCKVTGVTISREQLTEAQARVKAEGLEHLIDLRFCDYRQLPVGATFDRVVSIEMLEAVGHEHLQTYFNVVGSVLKPGGKAVIQVITRKDEGYKEYNHSSDFIRTHIFPGGHLPCMSVMVEAAQKATVELVVSDVVDIGLDYAVTLHEWRRRWNLQRADLLKLGYDDVFIRKYDFYFAYCEAGFAAQYIHDYIITWKPATTAGFGDLEHAPNAALLQSGSTTSDSWTQLILLVYIFLCGVCVGQVEGLWLAPGTALAGVLACKAVLPALAPSSLRSRSQKSAWVSALADLIFSLVICAVLAVHLADQSTLPPVTDYTQEGLLCGVLGYYTFKLWYAVTQKSAPQKTGSIVALVVALICFGSAVVRGLFMGLLSLTLLSHVHSVFASLTKLTRLNELTSAHSILKATSWVTFIVFQAIPHLLILGYVWQTRKEFVPDYTFLMAFGGMVSLNVNNVMNLQSMMFSKA